MATWLEKLQAYNFTVEHQPGLKHENADFLLRCTYAAPSCKHCEKREIADGQFQRFSSKAHGESGTDNSIQQPSVLKATQMEGVGEFGRTTRAACWEDSELGEAQLGDETLRNIILWLEEKRRPKWEQVSPSGPEVKAYWAQWDSLVLCNGVLYRKF